MEAYKDKFIVKYEKDLVTGKPIYNDSFIDCAKKVQIYRFNVDTLVVYVPSLNLGKSYFKKLKSISFDYQDSDVEVLFRFKEENIHRVAEVVKAKMKRKKVILPEC